MHFQKVADPSPSPIEKLFYKYSSGKIEEANVQ